MQKCAGIIDLGLDAEANSIFNTTLCGWDYYCDYKANRFPNYLFKARCRTANCNGKCNQENSSHNRCQSHVTFMLKTSLLSSAFNLLCTAYFNTPLYITFPSQIIHSIGTPPSQLDIH